VTLLSINYLIIKEYIVKHLQIKRGSLFISNKSINYVFYLIYKFAINYYFINWLYINQY